MIKVQSRQVKRRLAREAVHNPIYSKYKGASRNYRRHMHESQNNVVNNRRKTPGRNIYYQIIPLIEKRKNKVTKVTDHILVGLKTIRHIRPSQHFVRVQNLLVEQALKRKG